MTKSWGVESFTYKRPHANSFYYNSPMGVWNMHIKKKKRKKKRGNIALQDF
jgi:hypothetical protein